VIRKLLSMVEMFSLLVYFNQVSIFFTPNNFKCVFSGKEFFVGISERTNLGGARAVAAAFPEYPCTPVKVLSICQERLKVKKFIN
jgi:hypothetical protein